MDVSSPPDQAVHYSSPKRVQIWFLSKSRACWKAKCMQRKQENKRLKNQVAAVSHSRQEWREQAERHKQRLEQLEAENAQLKDQMERQKKIRTDRGRPGGTG
jgi:DNA repair exonuclease SbcCD ATPase subunit